MKKHLIFPAAVALVVAVAVVALRFDTTPARAVSLSTAPSSLVSAYDLTQLGFDVNAVSTIGNARVDSGAAVAIAEHETGATVPQEVIHATTARRWLTEPIHNVWIVVFAGAVMGGFPAGPVQEEGSNVQTLRRPVVDYTGVVVDDQTGFVLYTFKGGHQE